MQEPNTGDTEKIAMQEPAETGSTTVIEKAAEVVKKAKTRFSDLFGVGATNRMIEINKQALLSEAKFKLGHAVLLRVYTIIRDFLPEDGKVREVVDTPYAQAAIQFVLGQAVGYVFVLAASQCGSEDGDEEGLSLAAIYAFIADAVVYGSVRSGGNLFNFDKLVQYLIPVETLRDVFKDLRKHGIKTPNPQVIAN